MYTENPAKDALLVVKAALSNLLAVVAPALYMKLTHETGRGHEDEDAGKIAEYYFRCFHDYLEMLNEVEPGPLPGHIEGKTILEYGPGDILGVALLMYAHGAQSVDCVDRFPLNALSDKNLEVYRILIGLLTGKERSRAESIFRIRGKPESGFRPGTINYFVKPNGISGQANKYDMIISRAVLEHVNNLEQTMLDISNAMKHDGISIHQVDLKSHGLDRYRSLDFLTWPEILYRVMYKNKGFPNRLRANAYRQLADNSGLRILKMTPTGTLEHNDVMIIRSKVAKPFRDTPTHELSWLGFWMILEQKNRRTPA